MYLGETRFDPAWRSPNHGYPQLFIWLGIGRQGGFHPQLAVIGHAVPVSTAVPAADPGPVQGLQAETEMVVWGFQLRLFYGCFIQHRCTRRQPSTGIKRGAGSSAVRSTQYAVRSKVLLLRFIGFNKSLIGLSWPEIFSRSESFIIYLTFRR